MSDYTPNTEEVREAFASYEDIEFRIGCPESLAAFNRWLAEHDRAGARADR